MCDLCCVLVCWVFSIERQKRLWANACAHAAHTVKHGTAFILCILMRSLYSGNSYSCIYLKSTFVCNIRQINGKNAEMKWKKRAHTPSEEEKQNVIISTISKPIFVCRNCFVYLKIERFVFDLKGISLKSVCVCGAGCCFF